MIILKTRITNLTDKQRSLTWAPVSLGPRAVVELEGAYPTACRRDCMRNTMEAEIKAGWLKVELITNLPCVALGSAKVTPVEAPKAPVPPKQDYKPAQSAKLEDVPEGIVKKSVPTTELVNTDVRAGVEVIAPNARTSAMLENLGAKPVQHNFEKTGDAPGEAVNPTLKTVEKTDGDFIVGGPLDQRKKAAKAPEAPAAEAVEAPAAEAPAAEAGEAAADAPAAEAGEAPAKSTRKRARVSRKTKE